MAAADRNDGYCGHLGEDMCEPRRQDQHTKAFPLPIPEGKKTTLSIKSMGGVFYWKCTTCHEEMATEKWTRPLHSCNKDKNKWPITLEKSE